MDRKILRHIALKLLSLCRGHVRNGVIYYHDIGTGFTNMGTSDLVLHEHVRLAHKHGFRFVRPQEFPSSEKTLMLCFDDGFHGIYDKKQYFVDNGIVPMIFVAIDLIDRPGYLSWNEIRELDDIGFVFASHTWSHRSLTEVLPSEFKHELRDSRNELEQRLGHEVGQLCFPRGMFSLRVLEACEEAGYSTLFTSVPGDADQTVSIPGYSGTARLVPRILAQSSSASEFECILRGAMTPLQGRYLRKHFVAD